MLSSLPPGLLLIIGGLLIPLLAGRRNGERPGLPLQVGLVLIPLLSAWHLLSIPVGTEIQVSLFDYELTLIRVDRLALVWGYIFHIAALVAAVYSLHVRDPVQHASAFTYAGAAIGAVFAGDLITLFVFWELTAITSVFLIWASRSERSYAAGMRYLIIQVGSGVLLLAGTVLRVQQGDGLRFGLLGPIDDIGTLLIFIAFGIKCAFPLLHNWLQDAYPEATPTGTVWLSAFTTKLAVYALARGFPGTEILIPIGTLMAAFPIFYAVIENDLRRVLAYSLNNQLGFMVVGIGIGTPLALNGTAAHAFCHILYKALLFMSMGAVLLRTGTAKGSELGGLYKSMPWTASFCAVGAASISAFPLFSGFVSKSLIMTAAAEEHHTFVWLVLLFASAGVFHHSGIKIPFFAFFAHDSGKRVKEAPVNMLLAMGATAVLCIVLGCMPGPLYALLPFDIDYAPYTTAHVMTQLQLLMWSALAFTFLNRTGIYPPELPSTNLDSDWFYRRAYPEVVRSLVATGTAALSRVTEAGKSVGGVGLAVIRALHDPRGVFGRTWTTGTMVLFAAILLFFYLVVYFLH